MMHIQIDNRTSHKIEINLFEIWLKEIFKYLYPESKDIFEIVFVSRETMRQLNLIHRNVDYPTDVLTFDINGKVKTIKTIVVCIDVAIEQAKSRKISLTDEIRFLILHGLKHAQGIHHQ